MLLNVNMDQEIPNKRYRLIVDYKCQFPEKLYDVANDGALVKWNRNGSVSVTSEEEFENNVMRWYPGFLQIPSFMNFKRLFREYGFDRIVNQNNEYEWSHPCFIRGRRDLLSEIKTRRKSFRTLQTRDNEENDSLLITDDGKRFPTRRRARTKRFGFSNQGTPDKPDMGGCGDVITQNGQEKTNSYIVRTPFHNFGKEIKVDNEQDSLNSSLTLVDIVPDINKNHNAVKNDFTEIMNNFAVNELTEAEYNIWLEQQRKLDAARGQPKEAKVENSAPITEFWWLYKEESGDVIQVTNQEVKTEEKHSRPVETVAPCGFCKCCSAISNYVHVFGEVPENIQVIDLLEEVVETVKEAEPVPEKDCEVICS